MLISFTKMHGIGNDYIYIDCFKENFTADDAKKYSPILSNRHYSIGADGIILIMPSDNADVRMRMFNADGSESEMCGNGVRCVAKYAYDKDISKNNPMKIETLRGILEAKLLELSLAPSREALTPLMLSIMLAAIESVPIPAACISLKN